MSRRVLPLISLFTGAGGLDYGLEAAGFRTCVAVEPDMACVATLTQSRRGWPLIPRRLERIPTKQLLATAGLGVGEAALVIGGPPCQPFSKSGYWARGDSRRLKDPRARPLRSFLRVVEGTLPQAIVLENVQGLAFADKSEGLQLLLRGLQRINRRHGTRYEPCYGVLNAADFGVPQVRKRFFLVAHRDGKRLTLLECGTPDPADLGPGQLDSPLKRTSWDALADLEPDECEDLAPRGKWAGLLASIPEGENYLWHTERGGGRRLFGWRTRYWNFLLKLAKDQPACTLQAEPGPSVGPFHWDNRRLSVRELCRLQTFPDDVAVQGGRRACQRQVGNAVPSLLAEILGRAIRRELFGLPSLRASLRLLPPDLSATRPAPTRATDASDEFVDLEGDHAAHPGTGRGPAARRRNGKAVARAA